MEVPESGIVLVNKPSGMSSHDVVGFLRRKTGIKKIGHAGTLDPLADGLVIALIGRDATKQQDTFMGLPKVYEGTIVFGITSASEDAEGPLTLHATLPELAALNADTVTDSFAAYIGTTEQVPPLYSAIQVDGKRLYKAARAGTADAIEIPTRTITINAIELLAFSPLPETTNDTLLQEALADVPPQDIRRQELYAWYAARSTQLQQLLPTARIRVHCQKGVYIRSLARDIGTQVGTGAFLGNLTRTHIGEYALTDAVSVEQ